MTTKTKAQRLADALDNYAESHNCNEEAAAELLRLEAANAELLMAIDDFDKALSIDCIEHEDWPIDSQIALRNLRAAIAKHEGTS